MDNCQKNKKAKIGYMKTSAPFGAVMSGVLLIYESKYDKINTCKYYPKRAENCVFRHFWIGESSMKFINMNAEYQYDGSVNGKCTKRNGASTPAVYTCRDYSPSVDANKLL